MQQALWIAKTGLDAQQTRMTVISNNLANVNTTGFKQDRAVFEDLLYQTIRQPGAQSSTSTQLPSGLMLGTGVRTVATEKSHTQGNIISTGNALDIAIQGRGFFQVLKPEGEIAYTRDGTFQVNSDGQVVMSNGYPLEPAITIPTQAVSITVGTVANVGLSAAIALDVDGVDDIDISTAAGAQEAIKRVDSALTSVNSTRASLGAIQNRLESTVNSLSTTSENLSAARSRILDADFAAETAASALDSIASMISKMDEMSAAISSAANEQSTVAEDINRGIVKISQIAEHTAEGAHQSSEAVSTMSSLSEQLQEAAGKFKV
jgi:flagellar basal-body rod protein FlgG